MCMSFHVYRVELIPTNTNVISSPLVIVGGLLAQRGNRGGGEGFSDKRR